jgi:hypothetical protein
MATPSRIELARRRLKVARYSISAVALSAFAAFGFVVRDAHPATQSNAPAVVATSTSSAATDNSSTFFGGSASIGPAPQSAAPQIQSSGS